MKQEIVRLREHPVRIIFLVAGMSGLALVFTWQHVDWLAHLCTCALRHDTHFAVNKLLRVLANDLFMIVLVHFWFFESRITKLAFLLQFVDTFVMLPVYLFLKLWLEGPEEISHPFLSQLHRLIVNPTLLILLFPAVYLQRNDR